jgi:hypothetical protein
MADEAKYTVWGYWKKSNPDTHPQRKCIGKAGTLEEARLLMDEAEKLSWPTVCIFEENRIVEPAMWAGRQQPL